MMKTLTLIILGCAALGCSTDTASTDGSQPNDLPMDTPRDPGTSANIPTPTEPPPGATPVEITESEGERVDLAAPYDAKRRIIPRPRRRMNIDQLEAAIMQVSGGIGWTEQRGRDEVNLFESLSSTLGKPDYAEITDEELEPTVLFQKFLNDAARSVCVKMLAADLAALAVTENGEETAWSPRLLVHVSPDQTMTTHPDDIKANMQVLMQRFHGRRLSADASGLAHWHWLFRSASFVTETPTEAWLGVCVALFTHPDFYTY
jgi:hypothetical protein